MTGMSPSEIINYVVWGISIYFLKRFADRQEKHTDELNEIRRVADKLKKRVDILVHRTEKELGRGA